MVPACGLSLVATNKSINSARVYTTPQPLKHTCTHPSAIGWMQGAAGSEGEPGGSQSTRVHLYQVES